MTRGLGAVASLRVSGAGDTHIGGREHNEDAVLLRPDLELYLVADGAGTMTVYRPVRDPRPAGRIRPLQLPAADLAVAVHHGPHDDLDVTYGRLGAWVVAHTLAVAGPVHEIYVVGPRDTADPTAWRTEIGWPVFRVAQDGGDQASAARADSAIRSATAPG